MKGHLEQTRRIAQASPGFEGVTTIQPVKVGEESSRNEFLLFIKPEIFMVEQSEQIERSLELVFDKLDEFSVQTSGIVIVNGTVLDRMEIMNRHYGYINQLSRTASKILDHGDRRKIAEALNLPQADYRILGGHEYLTEHPDQSYRDLDQKWFAGPSTKIRSGFYVRKCDDCILVNGFHPAQLAYFTDASHRIVLILGHSNTDWAVLRNEMIGATYPEKASPGSIRGILYSQSEKFGLGSVTIANNGIHMSAGPFEGMFEIVNFFGKILGFEPQQNPPLVLQRLLDAGLAQQEALTVLDNPVFPEAQRSIDLFTATEDMDTEAAVAFLLEHLHRQAAS